MLEAKLKALSLRLSQRVAPRENGISKEELTSFPFPIEMTSMDWGRTIQLEPASEHVTNLMSSVDLNGTIQEDPADPSILNQGSMHGIRSGDSCGISKDDELIIQVD